MRGLVIKNNVVINTIIIDPNFIPSYVAATGYDSVVDASKYTPAPDIGWTYTGSNFSPPAVAPISPVQSTLPLYSTLTSFPISAQTGAQVIAEDTGIMYEFINSIWVPIAGPGVNLSGVNL